MTHGAACMSGLADTAWLGQALPDFDVGEADAYLLLDQYPPRGPRALSDPQLLMVPNLIVGPRDGEADCGNGGGSGCGSGFQSGSPAAQQARKLQGSSKRTTSVAQREAHKRYREKKKQSIAAMEAAVQAKRSQLEQLQAENDQLRSKARVLETAERCSVEIHELMKLLDGLQGLAEDDFQDASGANRAGSSCSDARNTAAAAADAAGRRSSTDHSSQEALPAIKACPLDAAPAQQQQAAPAQQQQHGSSFLQTLLTPVQQQPASATAPIKQEPGRSCSPALLSLQNEQHWLAMAERYLQSGLQPEQPSMQTATVAAGACAAAAPPAPAAPASSSAAAGEGACSAGGPCNSGMSPSETAESGSSVLAELGSVDTAEQGLVIYKAFLQKASEMLALAQQQQQQPQPDAAASTQRELGELTRSTIGRLQPFLVARGQGVVYDWNARNLETQQPEEPPAGLWSSVLDALHLDADTQRDALQCFELFGTPLTRLLEERLQLTQRYHQLMTPGGAAANPGAAADSSSSASDGSSAVVHVTSAMTFEAVAETLISSAAVLRALAANLERYQSLDGVFAHSLTNLLTGAQIAAACVASYPYLPRWHSMMAALKQRKEAESQQQLQSMRDAQQGQPQRRSSRARVATKAAKEAYA